MFNRKRRLMTEFRVMSPRRYAVIIIGALALNAAMWSGVYSQIANPGVQQSGAVTSGHCTEWGPGTGQIQDSGGPCAASTAGNPTATATTSPVNGVATTYMRSDAAPAVATTTFGGQAVGPGGTAAVQGNGAKIQLATGTATSGHCADYDANGNIVDSGAPCGGASGANPTATAGPAAVNGVATTFMRSDAAPAVQLGTATQKGIVQVDGTGICASLGVISLCAPYPAAANPTAAAGPTAINGTATTFMRSDAAPAVQGGSNSVPGIISCDGVGITCPTSSAAIVSATKAQQQAASASNVAVTPSIQQQHPSAAKAYVQITGASGAILASYNISGVTRNGMGDYTVNFTVGFSTANYACAPMIYGGTPGFVRTASQLAGSIEVQVVNAANSGQFDPAQFSLACFGTQ